MTKVLIPWIKRHDLAQRPIVPLLQPIALPLLLLLLTSHAHHCYIALPVAPIVLQHQTHALFLGVKVCQIGGCWVCRRQYELVSNPSDLAFCLAQGFFFFFLLRSCNNDGVNILKVLFINENGLICGEESLLLGMGDHAVAQLPFLLSLQGDFRYTLTGILFLHLLGIHLKGFLQNPTVSWPLLDLVVLSQVGNAFAYLHQVDHGFLLLLMLAIHTLPATLTSIWL